MAGSPGFDVFGLPLERVRAAVRALTEKGIAPYAAESDENRRIPGDRIIGEPGIGFTTALATLDHTRPMIGA